MARRVIWSEPAIQDLEAAAAYIARDSVRYAASLVRDAIDDARSLEDFTHRGRVVPELNQPAVRELFVRPGARDVAKLLRGRTPEKRDD